MRPVECHVPSILEYIVVGMPHDPDIPVSRRPWRAQTVQCMFCMRTIARDGSLNLLIHDNEDLHSCLCPPLQHLIQSPFLVVVRWSPQEKLWTQPPVLDVDCLFGLLQRDGHCPKVISPVDIPLDLVAVSFWRERLKAVRFSNAGALFVCCLLIRFVVTMVGIDNVVELADFGLEVVETLFGFV